MPIPSLILASSSPRRAHLLKQMGFDFRIITADVNEDDIESSDPIEHVIGLSRMKAEAILPEVASGVIVVGADTIVVLNGKIFGKPVDEDDAKHMLATLSGKTHQVYTGFTIIQVGGKTYSDVEETSVTFRRIESWEIDDYTATGSPMDKAGAYGIQDRSGLFVDRIEGCFYNVVGFPLTKFYKGLKHLLGSMNLRTLIAKDHKD